MGEERSVSESERLYLIPPKRMGEVEPVGAHGDCLEITTLTEINSLTISDGKNKTSRTYTAEDQLVSPRHRHKDSRGVARYQPNDVQQQSSHHSQLAQGQITAVKRDANIAMNRHLMQQRFALLKDHLEECKERFSSLRETLILTIHNDDYINYYRICSGPLQLLDLNLGRYLARRSLKRK